MIPAVLECPICRRKYDGFPVFVPPHTEAFDTVECARIAAEAWGWDEASPDSVVLSRVDVVSAPSTLGTTGAQLRTSFAPTLSRWWLSALAAGVGLLAAGTAASIYLLVKPPAKSARLSTLGASVSRQIPSPPTVTPGAIGSIQSRTTAKPTSHTKPKPTATTTVRTKANPPPSKPPPRKRPPKEGPLVAGVRYEAISFPVTLRVTPPDNTWAGAQWRTDSHGRPAFGWAALGRLPVDNPRGLIAIVSAIGPTPPVEAILRRVRSGAGVTYRRATRVTLAGFPGWQIDGRVVGRLGHVFVPFTLNTDDPRPPDSYRLDYGEIFRIIVLDVRGKSVVLFLESFMLTARQFTEFLTSANQILDSLEFPA